MVKHDQYIELSKKRLAYLQQRLNSNKDLMKKYDDIIVEQFQTGIIEPVLKSMKVKRTILRSTICLIMQLYAKISQPRKCK